MRRFGPIAYEALLTEREAGPRTEALVGRSWVMVFPTARDPSEPPVTLADLTLRHEERQVFVTVLPSGSQWLQTRKNTKHVGATYIFIVNYLCQILVVDWCM